MNTVVILLFNFLTFSQSEPDTHFHVYLSPDQGGHGKCFLCHAFPEFLFKNCLLRVLKVAFNFSCVSSKKGKLPTLVEDNDGSTFVEIRL